MPLTDVQIKNAARRSGDYKLFDGSGLFLLVRAGGTKLWRLKYRFDGKDRSVTLGRYPALSLAAARQKRTEAKIQVDEGCDPAEMLRILRTMPPTLHQFEEIARAWHTNQSESFDPAHSLRVINRLERDAFPILGKRQIASITPPEILGVIRKVEARGALDVSRRLKQTIGQVFRFGIANGWVAADPTAGLKEALKPKPRVKHMARVPLSELPCLMRSIRDYDGEATDRRREVTRDAILFTLLTWARTGETRFAAWNEIEDLDGASPVWRLSPERMKMDREHVVPLSHQAADLLRRRRSAKDGRFIFPGVKAGQPLSENTMIFACYRMGYRGRQTVHGFRGLASTWANEAEHYKPDWIEMALAHAEQDGVRGAYNSALYLSARKRMLQDWADALDGSLAAAAPTSGLAGVPEQPVADLALAYIELCA